VGDIRFQKKCLGKMEDVAKDGRTVIFVSHSLGTIQSLCNRGILLGQGTILADDTAIKAVQIYLSNLEQSSFEDLSGRTDRQGKGEVRLSKIEILTGGSYPSSTLATGLPVVFNFHITGFHVGVSCCFTIYDQSNQPITYFDSVESSQMNLTDPLQVSKFICEIDELLLIPGRYRINATVMCDGEFQDDVKGAAYFEVEPGTLGDRPVDRVSGYGNVIFRHRWIKPGISVHEDYSSRLL
jgi:lipopolysaccharide transport system ATP-binding protein